MGIGFDTAFVFTEVNADVVVYVKDPTSSWGFRKSEIFTSLVVLMVMSVHVLMIMLMLISRFLIALELMRLLQS